MFVQNNLCTVKFMFMLVLKFTQKTIIIAFCLIETWIPVK